VGAHQGQARGHGSSDHTEQEPGPARPNPVRSVLGTVPAAARTAPTSFSPSTVSAKTRPSPLEAWTMERSIIELPCLETFDRSTFLAIFFCENL
jgi:hypothetical protein